MGIIRPFKKKLKQSGTYSAKCQFVWGHIYIYINIYKQLLSFCEMA